jgi:SAM-dependent methyltransferase
MNDYLTSNRALWDAWTEAHVAGSHYDVPGFIAGRNTLHSLELKEVGDVSGKSLLHLQCHFGLDTLSWARLGAQVTGVDFSPKAIEAARSIADECVIPATFVLSDLYSLPENLTGTFDVVFTSYGAIYWLPDLPRWAEVIAHFLKPGGAFHIVDFHPMGCVFDGSEPDLRMVFPYFHSGEPWVEEVCGSYATDLPIKGVETGWAHSLADVVNSLIGAGLRLDFLHEFPYSTCSHPPLVSKCDDGLYRLKEHDGQIALLFSAKATKNR